MKVCVVGSENTIFVHGYIKNIKSFGYDVCFVNTSEGYNGSSVESSVGKINNYRNLNITEDNKRSKVRIFIKSLFSKLKGFGFFCFLFEIYSFYVSKKYSSDDLKKYMVKENPDVIIFFWCTTTRKEAFLISRLKSDGYINSKLIIDVGTYPVRDYVKENSFSYLFSLDVEYFSLFDKVFSHSSVLDEFLISKLKVDNGKIIRYVCELPLSSRRSKCVANLPNDSFKRKRIIFLGGINKNNIIDNIYEQIEYLSSLDVDIYMQDSDFKIRNVNYFKPFSFEEILSGELAEFINKFDGVLMLYGKMSRLRQKLTYPTRYALATLSEVPILVKRDVYDSLEELSSNQVFFYDDLKDIVSLLNLNKGITVFENGKYRSYDLNKILENL